MSVRVTQLAYCSGVVGSGIYSNCFVVKADSDQVIVCSMR